jgi:hypothetical protein
VDTVAAIAGAGLADNQPAAGYLADTWGCVRPSGSSSKARALSGSVACTATLSLLRLKSICLPWPRPA